MGRSHRGEAGPGVKGGREKTEEGEIVGGPAGVGGAGGEAGAEVDLLLRELQAESEDQEVCFGVHIPIKVTSAPPTPQIHIPHEAA